MQTPLIAEKNTITTSQEPAFINFLEDHHARMTGLVREIYKARGWIKELGDTDPHYQVTALGKKMLTDIRNR